MIQLNQFEIPKLPGVYIFKNEFNMILYIGKAKNLYNRILSYKTDRQTDWKLKSLLEESQTLEWVICDSEQVALLLEAELISNHKPLFNKLLMSDNPFIYITFSTKNNFSKIAITRYFSQKNEIIIGPFLSKREAHEFYDYIMHFFNLFTCKKKIEHGCLNYHIGKCAGNCKSDFDIKEYKKRYRLALAMIKNENNFLKMIEKEIKIAKKEFNFDQIEKLINYQSKYHELIYQLKKNENSPYINDIFTHIGLEENYIQNGLNELKNLLNLSVLPTVIDCIDISHFQGHAVTGACIRFVNGKYNKESSQAYKLPYNQNNDYENLIILTKNHYQSRSYPDILLIDGGKGQLNTIAQLKIPTNIIALAKREEMLFWLNNYTGVKITSKESYGKLLISLRNVTHNAAIKMHRDHFKKITLK